MRKLIKQFIPPFLIRYRCRTSNNRVALSFDDGPKARTTESILQTLFDFNMNATFFVLGKMVEENPEICNAIIETGNEIGNHSYSHTSLTDLTISEIKQELEKTDEIIKSVCNYHPKLFRPPNGALSLKLIWYLMMSRHQAPVLWSAMIKNEARKEADLIIKEFKELNLIPGDIILLHDVNSQTAEALPYMLDHIKSLNLNCVSIGNLL